MKCKTCQQEFVKTSNIQIFCKDCGEINRQEVLKRRQGVYYKEYKSLHEAAVYTVRKCLNCQKSFKSEGIHNRVCLTCKAKEIYGTENNESYGVRKGRNTRQL